MCIFTFCPRISNKCNPLHQSYSEKVTLLAPLPLCLFSPGVMQTPFHRQNILCRSCQSVYPQAWVPIWGLTSNIENWPAAPTAFPAKRPCREWEREGGGGGSGGRETAGTSCWGKRGGRRRGEEVRGQEGSRGVKWEGENENEWVVILNSLLSVERHKATAHNPCSISS